MERNSKSSDKKYLRLVYCLIETCSKSARRLVLFYLDKSRPVDLNGREWTIDEFLHEKRERLQKLNPSQRAILFPGFSIKTKIDEWDISILFMILELFKLDDVITKDIMAIKKMRNKIFHAASTSINSIKYGEYKDKITVYVENCCDILGDQTLATGIAHIFQEAEEKEMDDEERTHIMCDFDNWFKSDPLFECIDKFPSDIGSIMDVLFKQIVNLLRNYRFKIPDAYLSLQISSCNPGTSEMVSDQILKHLCDETSPDSELGKAISGAKNALIDKQRQLVEKRKGCLILRIRCEDLEGFWCLISDCITGKLTSSWHDVQNIVREEHGAPYLTIEVGVTASEIISCVEELIQNIGIGIKQQMLLSKRRAILDEKAPKHHLEGKEYSLKRKRDCDAEKKARSSRSSRSRVDDDFKRRFIRQQKWELPGYVLGKGNLSELPRENQIAGSQHPLQVQPTTNNPTVPVFVRQTNRNELYAAEAEIALETLHGSLKNDAINIHVTRDHIVDDVMNFYTTMDQSHVKNSVHCNVVGEEGLDVDGVTRDVFTTFWQKAIPKYFTGNIALVPKLSRQTCDDSALVSLGRIFAHSTALFKTIPVQICRSTLNVVIFGEMKKVTDSEDIIIDDFLLYVDSDDRAVLEKGLANFGNLDQREESKLWDIFANYGMPEIPRQENLRRNIAAIAHNELCIKPKVACDLIGKGIPELHRQLFWGQMNILHINELYKVFRPTPQKVVDKLKCRQWPLPRNSPEQRSFDNLKRFVANLSTDTLRKFLHFVTGERKIPNSDIIVEFTNITGVSRGPIPHTCSCLLELPKSYTKYEELRSEFLTVLEFEEAFVFTQD